MTAHLVRLDGCRTDPLLSYLSALGVARLVAEQADTRAVTRWSGNSLELRSELDTDALVRFFIQDWEPTPLVTPWNSDTGLRPAGEKQRKSENLTNHVLALDAPRLLDYRQALAVGQDIATEARARGWADSTTKPNTKFKAEILALCRARMSEKAVAWVDAAAVVTDSTVAYPLTLGTGGNLGRLELATNHLRRVTEVLGCGPAKRQMSPQRSEALLQHALLGVGNPPLVRESVAQYHPGGAGGANTSAFGDGAAYANPWEYVLAMEGALLFAASIARRLGRDDSGRDAAALPFTVLVPTPHGYATATSGETTKGEIWCPVWHKWSGMGALRQLMREGRAQWNGRQVRTGLDMARAVSTLGVDHGVDRFVRYAIAERFGQMTLAVNAGEFDVVSDRQTRLTADLDRFLDRCRSSKLPAAATVATRRADRAVFEVTTAPEHRQAEALQSCLIATARLEHTIARSPATQKVVPRPLGPIGPAWLGELDDGTPEFRVALALALQTDRRQATSRTLPSSAPLSMAELLRPVQVEFRARPNGRTSAVLEWGNSRRWIRGLASRPLVDVLVDAAIARVRAVARTAPQATAPDQPGAGAESPNDSAMEHDQRPEADDLTSIVATSGIDFAFRFTPGRVNATDAAAFVSGMLDDDRIAQLLMGLLLIEPTPIDRAVTQGQAKATVHPAEASPIYWSLTPFLIRDPINVVDRDTGTSRRVQFRMRPEWVAQLAAGNIGKVAHGAGSRLRFGGLHPSSAPDPDRRDAALGRRLAAATLLPLTPSATRTFTQLRCPTDTPPKPMPTNDGDPR